MKRRPLRRSLRRATAFVLLLPGVLALGALGLPAPTASAYPYATISFIGHGWGHGIGMGQWGSLGYALGDDNGQHNWSYQQILTHYYGGTSIQTVGPSTEPHGGNVLIAMTENNGSAIFATSPTGVTVPGGGSATAVQFLPNNNGTWNVYRGPGCGGGWTFVSTVPSPTTGAVGGGQITLCMSTSINMYGTLTGVYNSLGAARTVNTVGLEQYVADVAPGESPSSWGTLGTAGPQGQAWGFQQSEAQTVAARSYVLANPLGYGGYADTCDLSCQTYRGTTYQTSLSVLAAQDTAGQVMEEGTSSGGTIATTEYSASTGGYTTGGPFPSVVDDGDAICVSTYVCNPNHTWHATLAVSKIEAQWPQIGTLDAINVTSRNGEGDWGGRINRLSLVGSVSTLSMTGSEFSDDMGLNSDWFTVSSQPSGGVGGYWLGAADGGIFSFGNALFYGSMGGQPLNQPVVGMAPTVDHAGYWQVAADGGMFSFGDAHFYGSMGGQPLNQPVVGMTRTPDGAGYWQVASDGGVFSFGDAHFYGSMGGQPLNRPIVGIASTPDGKGYWMVASDGGIFSFGDATFYGSTGSLALRQPIVGMAAAPNGTGYWLAASDGGVFTFGTATFEGSGSGTQNGNGTVAMLSTKTGQGYLLINQAGAVTNYGDAPQFGDITSAVLGYTGRVVGGATTPG